jgi:hypothetical protein
MPPYMRDSDASPLSLNRRQYDFLMQTMDRLQTKRDAGTGAPPDGSSRAQDHVSRVVERLSSGARVRKAQNVGRGANNLKPGPGSKGSKSKGKRRT